jgi:hypothetical protein
MTDKTPETKPESYTTAEEVFDSCVALKSMPHVYDKVKKLWGFPAFFNYMDGLMLVEQGREGRQGFPEEVYQELNRLEHFFASNPDLVAHPSLVASDHDEIKKIIKDRIIKLNYTVGDRR